jgi:hypothetical protein
LKTQREAALAAHDPPVEAPHSQSHCLIVHLHRGVHR